MIYEDLIFHNENCCQLAIFKLEPNFSIFKKNCETKKMKLINDIIEMKKIPYYLKKSYKFHESFRKEFKFFPLSSKGSKRCETAYNKVLQDLKKNESNYKKEDFNQLKKMLLDLLHRNLEHKVKHLLYLSCLRSTNKRQKLQDIINQYVLTKKADQDVSENNLEKAVIITQKTDQDVSENDLEKTHISPSNSILRTLNENQLRYIKFTLKLYI